VNLSPTGGGHGYSQEVNDEISQRGRVLLIDTCGEKAAVALCRGAEVLRVEEFAERGASAGIIAGVRRLLEAEGWPLGELDGIGVVNGPGSFTGLRAGLAAAKGLCEAASLPLAAVSRLAVLAGVASLGNGFAALSAGRGELYVREISTEHEWMCGVDEFRVVAEGAPVVIAEACVAELLAEKKPQLYPLQVGDALALVRRSLQQGGCDVATVDANYVRGESEIYRKQAGAGAR
jgi:tRNA threonylcarbamoyladenosine biosynthesis protein TsaB